MIVGEWLPPEVPIGWQNSQPDRHEVLLQVEYSDGHAETHLLEHDPDAEAVFRIDKNSSQDRRADVQNDDGVHIGRRGHPADPPDKGVRRFVHRQPDTNCLMSDRT